MAKLFQYILIVCFLIIAGYCTAIAQHKISGTVKDTHDVAIAHAGITLKKENGFVVAYSQSNDLGNYSFVMPASSAVQQLFIEVNLLGYKKTQQRLQPNQFKYDFVLSEEAIDLKEVQIKRKVEVVTKGDTLRYNVS
ncbi:MAG: carboxypeptidase regulatory-like domain-containing protein, partial [Pedobacter sp.]